MNYFVSLQTNIESITMKLLDNKTYSINGNNGYLMSIVLITACFALWGFANNVTTPMVAAFSKIFRISTTEATLVPIAFNLGYFCMAFPAALFIQRYSFKLGVITGLGIYALGALLFLPAKIIGIFPPFLLSYFILTCGLSFLETSCNPYIYCMGNEQTGIRRLNSAQAFNALGSLAGMLVAMAVHADLSPMSSHMRQELPMKQFEIIKNYDLNILIQPYILIASLVVVLLVILWFTNLPTIETAQTNKAPMKILRELLGRQNYREGVLAEFFYIAAQVGCWTFIIQYGTRIFIAEGMTEQAAEVLSQKYNIAAMVCFACSRFICTWLMKWFAPERMLSVMAILGITALFGTIAFTNRNGLYCLVAVSICLSLMFPTIYGLALRGIGQNIKIAGAGLIMSFVGGSLFPPIQAAIIQSNMTLFGLPSTNISFILPMICLGLVCWYGHRAYVRHAILKTEE